MKTEEFLNLPSREQDEIVHLKVMDKKLGYFHEWNPRSGYHEPYEVKYNPPAYTTDIKAAWEVVEKFAPNDITFGDCGVHLFEIFWDCGGWFVKTHRACGNIVEISMADTAPLAICLAALKAKGVIE